MNTRGIREDLLISVIFMKIVIVIPTYNERGNIGKLLEALEKEFKKIIHHQMSILVVDGGSPDGTGEVVKEKMKLYKNVRLLETEKGGLGADYVKGFKYAMEKMDVEVVFEMDADFQHNPKDVPRLLKEIDKGADYVLGSRFISGGSIPKEWDFKRKFLSKGGNLFARTVLGIRQIHDVTTGFKASRVKGFLDQIDLDNLLSRSYAYKIHLLYEMIKMGAKTREVPIHFALRKKGWSKMDWEDFIESLKVVLALRLREFTR